MKPRTVLTVLAVAAASMSAGMSQAQSGNSRKDMTLAVTMTNDASSNQIKVFDAATLNLLQTIPTNGAGGVGGNARGIRQYNDTLVAVVNNGSNSVATFRRNGNRLVFDRLVTTSSPPVSVDFGNGHMYVAGATTVDSFVLQGNKVGARDGTVGLSLVGGGVPSAGSTAQVGVVDDQQLLVTLKTDPTPGTVDVVPLRNGVITGAPPSAVSAPAGTLTPFGFSADGDGSAVITLAHTNQVGLFRDGAFTTVITPGQAAPCWMTKWDKYLFTANTGSKTISRLIATGNHIFVDAGVAATVTTGGAPSDIDSEGDVLAVIDHGGGASHLTVFSLNEFGELSGGNAINLAVSNANGIALIAPSDAPDEN